MSRTLKAVKPEVIKESKPKLMISGKSGVGKTFFALDFPAVYYIDVEGGAERKEYKDKLTQSGGVYFGKEQGSQDFNTVIEELKTLATVKHEYRTLCLDSFSKLYNIAAAIAEERVGNDYGKDRKEANRPTRQLMRWLEALDMTVILVCHMKDKWERKNGELTYSGTTFDGYDKLEYDLDLWIEAQKEKSSRRFVVKKSRISAFPEGETFPLNYSEFAKLYGVGIIEKETVPLKMATVEQIEKIKTLIDLLKVEPEIIEKWKTKAKADTWDEFEEDKLEACIKLLEDRLKAINGKEVKK